MKKQITEELIRLTGTGKMSADINLSLCGNDLRKAVARMKTTYPGLEVSEEELEKAIDRLALKD
jgi:hypothetical protein